MISLVTHSLFNACTEVLSLYVSPCVCSSTSKYLRASVPLCKFLSVYMSPLCKLLVHTYIPSAAHIFIRVYRFVYMTPYVHSSSSCMSAPWMSSPCVCPLLVYFPSACNYIACSSFVVFSSFVYCFHVWCPSKCTSLILYITPRVHIPPYVCLSLYVCISPPCVCPFYLYVSPFDLLHVE